MAQVAASKIQTTIVLTRAQRAEVVSLSEKTGAPFTAIVRLALAAYLAEHAPKKETAEA